VVLERVVGDLELPPEVAVVAAANPPEQAADGWDLSPPLANRFCHLDWPVDARTLAQGFTSGWPTPRPPTLAPEWETRVSVTRSWIAGFITARPMLALAVPDGEPNETVDVVTEIDAPPAETWELLQDFPKMSRLLPGVDLSRELGDDRYEGAARIHMGPMRLTFAGAAQVIERDASARSLRAIAAGRDISGGGVRADLLISADPRDGGGTRVRAQAKLYLSGRPAQFGRSLAGDVSRQAAAMCRDRHPGAVGRTEYAPNRGCGVPSDQRREVRHGALALSQRTRLDGRRHAVD